MSYHSVGIDPAWYAKRYKQLLVVSDHGRLDGLGKVSWRLWNGTKIFLFTHSFFNFQAGIVKQPEAK